MTELSEMLNEPVAVANVPFKHVLGKFIVASIASFAAAQLCAKAYDGTVTFIHNRQSAVPSITEG
jgi:hypothetical protein